MYEVERSRHYDPEGTPHPLEACLLHPRQFFCPGITSSAAGFNFHRLCFTYHSSLPTLETSHSLKAHKSVAPKASILRLLCLASGYCSYVTGSSLSFRPTSRRQRICLDADFTESIYSFWSYSSNHRKLCCCVVGERVFPQPQKSVEHYIFRLPNNHRFHMHGKMLGFTSRFTSFIRLVLLLC
jgi:hypothetical protein